MNKKILLGFESPSGEPVSIGITHTVFAGITRVGKSETVKTAVARSKDIRFLILDVKKPRDYQGLGVEVPIYIEEKTDPLMLKRLLESQSHLALKFEFPELLKVCKKANTYPKILEAVNEGLEAKKHPIVKDKLLVLQHLLSRLVKELEATPIVDKLELKNRINVMDLSDISREMQQLAIHSTLKTLLQKESNVVVVADEFHRFAPQQGSNASKETITDYIKEGGAKNLWLWVIDQTITGIEKQVLKQCWIWILGKQREINEAKRTLDQIPFKSSLTDKDVMRLKRGHFIVCTEDFAKLTYVWLSDVPKDIAKNVALEKISVQSVISLLEKGREKKLETVDAFSPVLPHIAESVKSGDVIKVFPVDTPRVRLRDVVPKKRFSDLQEEHEKAVAEIKGLNKECARLQNEYQEAEKEIKQLIGSLKIEKKRIEELETENADLNAVLKVFNNFKSVIGEMFIQPAVKEVEEVSSPLQISVDRVQPVLSVTVKRTVLELSDRDVQGRLAILYAEGIFDKWISLSVVNKALLSHAWGRTNSTKHLNTMAQWGFLEKKQAGNKPIYKQKISPEEAREKGLLVEKEITEK